MPRASNIPRGPAASPAERGEAVGDGPGARAAPRGEAVGDGLAARLAGAPISWGVCEVPGWGRQLDPERVLSEMAGLGLRATELGPTGYLPTEPGALLATLERHGLRLVAGFVPLVLHAPDAHADLAAADQTARTLAAAGADVFLAALVADHGWSRPRPLDDAAWNRLTARLQSLEQITAGHGLTLAVHPHWDTQIETASDVARLLETTTTALCLDTGHLALGGQDPAALVATHGDRIAHVHLKDVDERVAVRLRRRVLTLVQATQAGLFRPLGEGDVRIDTVLRRLDRQGYADWLVLEQDTAITGEEPPVGSGPVVDVARSIDFVNMLALDEEEETVA